MQIPYYIFIGYRKVNFNILKGCIYLLRFGQKVSKMPQAPGLVCFKGCVH